jgi:hypothetical protein
MSSQKAIDAFFKERSIDKYTLHSIFCKMGNLPETALNDLALLSLFRKFPGITFSPPIRQMLREVTIDNHQKNKDVWLLHAEERCRGLSVIYIKSLSIYKGGINAQSMATLISRLPKPPKKIIITTPISKKQFNLLKKWGVTIDARYASHEMGLLLLLAVLVTALAITLLCIFVPGTLIGAALLLVGAILATVVPATSFFGLYTILKRNYLHIPPTPQRDV